MRIAALFIIVLVFIASCAPPASRLGQDASSAPVIEPESPESQDASEPVDSELSEEPIEDSGPAEEKSIDCVSGTKTCKGERLIECRSGKLIMKENCGLRGCYKDHCGECVPNTVECVGSELVSCTKDGWKDVKKCFRCINNECEEAPAEPASLQCADVKIAELENPGALLVYSPFKKDYVEQQLVLYNGDGNELGRFDHKGRYTTTNSRKGSKPLYFRMERCHVQCILEFPIIANIQCEDHKGAKVFIPAHIGFIRTPPKFFVSQDGSTYYGDDQNDGEGDPLPLDQIFTKEHLAMQAR